MVQTPSTVLDSTVPMREPASWPMLRPMVGIASAVGIAAGMTGAGRVGGAVVRTGFDAAPVADEGEGAPRSPASPAAVTTHAGPAAPGASGWRTLPVFADPAITARAKHAASRTALVGRATPTGEEAGAGGEGQQQQRDTDHGGPAVWL